MFEDFQYGLELVRQLAQKNKGKVTLHDDLCKALNLIPFSLLPLTFPTHNIGHLNQFIYEQPQIQLVTPLAISQIFTSSHYPHLILRRVEVLDPRQAYFPPFGRGLEGKMYLPLELLEQHSDVFRSFLRVEKPS